MSRKDKIIIGYFHICQTDHWERSFDFIMAEIRKNGLYDATTEIRCGIVNSNGSIIPNDRFNDPKIKIVVYGNSSEYERPTLIHMRHYSNSDPSNTAYWYVHTKGLRHFGTPLERNVMDWTILLVYWNISHWRLAVNMLNYFDTYGCNGVGDTHYSGNFWWATSSYINTLPTSIGSDYVAPEFWICSNKHKMCNIYTNELAGGGNYHSPLDINRYALPDHFNIDAYKYLGNLVEMPYYDLIPHFLNHGRYEGRIFSVHDWFKFDEYRKENNLGDFTDGETLWHYLNHKHEYK
jgi:hypothetical protein